MAPSQLSPAIPNHTKTSKTVETRLFINNEFVESVSGKRFDVIDPSTEKVSASVYEADVEDVELAVQAAKAAFPAWSERNAVERAHFLNKWADALEKAADEISYLDSITMGKPAFPDRLAPMVPIIIRFFASKALDITGESSLNSAGFLNVSLRQPYGVCAAITPWNAPLMMLAYKVSAALITGNTLVLKSSEKSPLSSLVAARCALEAGFPPCTATGKAIQRAAAETNLKSVSLELGGKSPLLVFDDANLEKAVSAATISILMNSGQVCNATTRIYVHEKLAQDFIDGIKAAMSAMGASGNPLHEGTMRGPQADRAQFERILSYLDLAKQSGVSIALGGNRESSPGYFVEATLLTDVPEDSRLVKEEIFGPVLIVNRFTDEEDVLQRANDTEYGLWASVFTNDVSRAIRVAKRLEAGSVGVNCTSPVLAMDMPFGGWKSSGQGREFSRYATDYWTELKTVYFAY
ncbi:aldehyde dehydrogenase [Metarhizium anisopliae]|nr:aldehyde dehydrogenase [Metarhizium anisopliae]